MTNSTQGSSEWCNKWSDNNIKDICNLFSEILNNTDNTLDAIVLTIAVVTIGLFLIYNYKKIIHCIDFNHEIIKNSTIQFISSFRRISSKYKANTNLTLASISSIILTFLVINKFCSLSEMITRVVNYLQNTYILIIVYIAMIVFWIRYWKTEDKRKDEIKRELDELQKESKRN